MQEAAVKAGLPKEAACFSWRSRHSPFPALPLPAPSFFRLRSFKSFLILLKIPQSISMSYLVGLSRSRLPRSLRVRSGSLPGRTKSISLKTSSDNCSAASVAPAVAVSAGRGTMAACALVADQFVTADGDGLA